MLDLLSKKSMRLTGALPSYLPYLICFLAAAFYLYEFILQASPAVITHELMRDFMVDASGVGVISACYYFAYAPMQIPAGLLYDRYGARLLLTIAVVVVASGSMLFMSTHSVITASLGRFLMGAGSAFSFIGTLVLVSRWFPARYFALIAGIVQLMSSVGAILSGMPLANVISAIGWRQSFFGLGVIGLVLACLIWFIVRDRPEDILKTADKAPEPETPKQTMGEIISHEYQRLCTVLKQSQTRYVALFAFLVWAPITVFPLLWGVPYLKTLYGIGSAEAASMTMMIWVGIGVGSPLSGWVSNLVQRRCFPLMLSSLIGLVCTAAILYLPRLPIPLMMILLFGFGLAASGQSLSFAVVNDNTKRDDVGTAIGFNNMAVVVGGFLFQPLIGWILDCMWDGKIEHGVRMYHLMDYRSAMLLIPLCYLFAFYLAKRHIKETRCQPQHNCSKDPEHANSSTGTSSELV